VEQPRHQPLHAIDAEWHQDLDEVFCEGLGQCLQTQDHKPSADALARRASATQWAEAQLEEEIAALLRKAKAELDAEAAADQARQRERKARCAERQAAEAQASANEATAQADAAAEAEAAKIRANAARRPASSPLLERRDNGPKPPRRWPCRRPRRLDSGLQLPDGGRWSPPGDRGGGDQQPGQ
jgi:hypothetical protein